MESWRITSGPKLLGGRCRVKQHYRVGGACRGLDQASKFWGAALCLPLLH